MFLRTNEFGITVAPSPISTPRLTVEEMPIVTIRPIRIRLSVNLPRLIWWGMSLACAPIIQSSPTSIR